MKGDSRAAAAATAGRTVRRASVTPLALGRRRVPLVSAVGLAGLLLAGLLLAGALTALQAGSARPIPTVATTAAPAATPALTPVPTATPDATPNPTAQPSPTVVAPALPAERDPGDQKRRTNN